MNYRRLIGKMESYRIRGSILSCVTEYLRKRTQVVIVNGTLSSSVPVVSGIPQGTVLGPLLFIIYINDLLDDIKSDGYLYADDTKLFHHISSQEDAITPTSTC